MWLCETKLKVKIAHFQLPSASKKRACEVLFTCLVFPASYGQNWLSLPASTETALAKRPRVSCVANLI